MKESVGVASVERAILLLSTFDEESADLTLAQLAQRSGLYKSTILRLLLSLEARSYVVRLPSGSYRLGPELFRLGALYQKSFRLEDHIRPVLERLATETRESASFSIAEGDHRLCLFRSDSNSSVRHAVRIGVPFPLSRGVNGKVLTTFAAGAKLSDPREIRQLPYVSLGKTDLDIATIGGPVFGVEGKLLGAISISGPTARYNKNAIAEISNLLLANLRNLTLELGGDSGWFCV